MLSAGQYTQSKRWRKSTCDSCAGARQTDEGRTASSGTTLQLFHPKALPSRLARLTPSRTERETRGAERSPRSGPLSRTAVAPCGGAGTAGLGEALGAGRRSGRGGRGAAECGVRPGTAGVSRSVGEGRGKLVWLVQLLAMLPGGQCSNHPPTHTQVS